MKNLKKLIKYLQGGVRPQTDYFGLISSKALSSRYQANATAGNVAISYRTKSFEKHKVTKDLKKYSLKHPPR